MGIILNIYEWKKIFEADQDEDTEKKDDDATIKKGDEDNEDNEDAEDTDTTEDDVTTEPATDDTADTPAPDDGTQSLVLYDSPRTTVLNNLKKLKSLVIDWFNGGHEKDGMILMLDTIEISGARGIRDCYIKFSITKGNTILDFQLTCPNTQAKKGDGLNTVGAYYGTVVLLDTRGFKDSGRSEHGEENPLLAKKIIDVIKPDELSFDWIKGICNELLKETMGGKKRDPSEEGEKDEFDNDTF